MPNAQVLPRFARSSAAHVWRISWLFAAVIAASWISPTFATDVGQLVAGGEGKDKKQAEAGAVIMPDALRLRPDWWEFFAVDGEALLERIKDTVARLESTVSLVQQPQRDELSEFVHRIRANLGALPAAQANTAKQEPPPASRPESYSIEDLLERAGKLRDIQNALKRENGDLTRRTQAVKAASKRLDDLFAAYLALAESHPSRFEKGLAIMADRSALAVAQEGLRIKRSSVQNLEKQVDWLNEELTAARRLLKASADELKKIDGELEKTDAQLEKSRAELLEAQTRALGIVGGTEASKTESHLREQRVIYEGIGVGLARSLLAGLEAKRLIVALLSQAEDFNGEAIRDALEGWQDISKELADKIQGWRKASTFERDHASESLAALASDQVQSDKDLVADYQKLLKLAQDSLLLLQRTEHASNDLRFLIELLETELRSREGFIRGWLITSLEGFEGIWEQSVDLMNDSLFKIGDTPVTTLGLVRVVIILTVAWWISHLFRRAVMRIVERREDANTAALYTLGRLGHYVIIVIGMVVALSSIGIDFTNFALVAGALSVGIGFGLQSIVNNFVSGLILLFERTVKVGDFIELDSGVAGQVREINVRSTLINTNDNVDIVVPNSELVGGKVTNWTLREVQRRIHVPFGVAYGSDKDLVSKAALEAADKVPYTLKGKRGREPDVWLVNFGDSSLDFELVVWILANGVKRPGRVQATYLWEIETALGKYGIEIPFPQRDLHLRSGFLSTTSAQPDGT